MKLSEVMRIAWEAIVKNKIRSFLTMLGIIIGVAAVIIMVAISAGTEATIQDQITSLGSNLLFVQSNFVRFRPGSGGDGGGSGGLIYEDATAIQDEIEVLVQWLSNKIRHRQSRQTMFNWMTSLL